MKQVLAMLALALFASLAGATGIGVKSDHLGTPPDRVTVSVNGATLSTCTLNLASVPVTSTCDVTSKLTAAGVYTIITTAIQDPDCSGATCTGGGTASSAPFSLTWAPANVTSQGLRAVLIP